VKVVTDLNLQSLDFLLQSLCSIVI